MTLSCFGGKRTDDYRACSCGEQAAANRHHAHELDAMKRGERRSAPLPLQRKALDRHDARGR